MEADRIVRLGTHKRDGRFPDRIRQHYGRVHSLRGDKNSSVFRKHIGGALMNRRNPQDPRLMPWLTQGGPSFTEIEEEVSSTLRQRYSFSCFNVEDARDRFDLERGLIALIAQSPHSRPSAAWLGHHAASPLIRRSGLWNEHHVDSQPLTAGEFQLLDLLIQSYLGSLS